MTRAWPAVLLCACGTASAGDGASVSWSFEGADEHGDVRLAHPAHPDIGKGTFDLERAVLMRVPEGWRFEATFAVPVPTMTEVRAARDRVVSMAPQTVDIYLDTRADAGHVEALPGRGFRVPAAEAWDRVLVASSVPDLSEDDAIVSRQVTTAGRRLVAMFPADAVPAVPRGVLIVVLATAASGEGRVRAVGRGGDCRVWDDLRCVLEGDGPAVVDALGLEVVAGRPLGLRYAEGARPAAKQTPVVFQRGTLIGAAPVEASQVTKGQLATIVDETGAALATAVVLSVVGDVASLELVAPAPIENARGVVFVQGGTPR